MCNKTVNTNLLPLTETHLEEVERIHPKQASFARALYAVLTQDLTPQVNLLVCFVVLKRLYDEGKAGIFSEFGRVLYAPLSIVAHTAEHEWTRFRPKPVEELHTSFLSFMMAKPNREALNVLLGTQKLCFSQAHCCGILFGAKDDIAALEASELYKARNKMRSYAESMAMPVVDVPFEDVPLVTSDLGNVEREFYALYEETFAQMTPHTLEGSMKQEMNHLWDGIIQKIAHVPTPTDQAVKV